MEPPPAAKLTSKGQLTIPKRVRERLGLRKGDEVEFVETRESDQSGSVVQGRGAFFRPAAEAHIFLRDQDAP